MIIVTERMRLVSALCCACLLAFSAGIHADGKLVIVGGALKSGNAAVHRAFIDALPPVGPVVIIPAASGQPARASRDFYNDLVLHGFDRTRIVVYPLAVRDDSATGEVDESAWAGNAWDEQKVAALGQPAGFWLTGGDQMRITETLLSTEKGESALLRLMRERLAAGAVVGGSSAGAAVMSVNMIAGGTSFEALLQPVAEHYESIEDQDSGRLYMTRGLGFLPEGLVDQHFDRKARLGRLARALGHSGDKTGFGIDEDTALVVDLQVKTATVLGAGAVTILNAASASFAAAASNSATVNGETGLLASNLFLSVAPSGVSIDLQTLALSGELGQPTRGNEYYGYQPLDGGGMAFANARIDEALGHDLLDNHQSQQLRRLSFDGDGRMLAYIFSETEASQGYWLRHSEGNRYAIANVRFDISTR